jgi:2Fe-2S ferredoxin|tara:strand:+ start:3675 stop:3998 length:324 start_codon:yes stop_codon:yes gene_type:complete
MPTITFFEADGTKHIVDVENGISVMESAVRNDVPGIDGDCGGSCACATCHVYVDPAWIEKTGRAEASMEKSLLDFAEDVRENSRLGCQIAVTDDLDGLILELPVAQY